MHVQEVRNVCQALSVTIKYLNDFAEFEDSRNGRVLVSPVPVCTVTKRPWERVLFSPVRDANPFFHMFEALWMLSGFYDARPLDYFIKNFSKQFAEEDGMLHGAYGCRWRTFFGFDQLNVIVDKLTDYPHDRQCVLQMWDVRRDYGDDLLGDWKDRPCNTHAYVRNNDGALDLTVCCRSNDMIWGAHGANAVHFSILQEYLASRCNLPVGVMYQISNNAHAYLDVFNKLVGQAGPELLLDDRYSDGSSEALQMFTEPKDIDDDLYAFMSDWELFHLQKVGRYRNLWFSTVATPALLAFHSFKQKKYKEALLCADDIAAPDWRMACKEWIQRRVK